MLSGYPAQSHEMLFDAQPEHLPHWAEFRSRGIYDNMKTAVDKVCQGQGRIVNTRFFAMVSHYLFEADFCNVASGWEKGRGREERAGCAAQDMDRSQAAEVQYVRGIERLAGGTVAVAYWTGTDAS